MKITRLASQSDVSTARSIMMLAVFVMSLPVKVPVRPRLVAVAMVHWDPAGVTVPPT